ncbi:MAG TPA: DUF1439 domain-containing protein [Ramlibacter sp.]|nr:DUF1439 domain-containing protein [Ramlibacter sp.]
MDRRTLLSALACWPAARVCAQEGASRPRLKISIGTLRREIAQRFPLDLALAGVAQLRIATPLLTLLPASQQVASTFALQLAGPQLEPQAGEVDVAFRLRFEPSDRTVRAHRIELLAVRWAGLAPEMAQIVHGLLPQLVRDSLGDVVLYRFADRELALADTMGFQPDELVVLSDGVLVRFAPKPLISAEPPQPKK